MGQEFILLLSKYSQRVFQVTGVVPNAKGQCDRGQTGTDQGIDQSVLMRFTLRPGEIIKQQINKITSENNEHYKENNTCSWYLGASLRAQLVKNPPAVQATLVRFLGWGDPLEKR